MARRVDFGQPFAPLVEKQKQAAENNHLYHCRRRTKNCVSPCSVNDPGEESAIESNHAFSMSTGQLSEMGFSKGEKEDDCFEILSQRGWAKWDSIGGTC